MIDRDTIIKLAREAGFREPNPHDGCMGLAFDFRDGSDTGASLERFAALIAAAEREACAKVCDPEPSLPNEAYTVLNNKATMRRCAAAIRKRSTP